MRSAIKFRKPGCLLLLAALAYAQVMIVDGFRTIDVTTPTFSLTLRPVSFEHTSLKYALISATAEDKLYLHATFRGDPNKAVRIALRKDGLRKEDHCVTSQDGRCYFLFWMPDARMSGSFAATVNIKDGEQVRIRGRITRKFHVLSTVWEALMSV